jgi:hypothetical protein
MQRGEPVANFECLPEFLLLSIVAHYWSGLIDAKGGSWLYPPERIDSGAEYVLRHQELKMSKRQASLVFYAFQCPKSSMF